MNSENLILRETDNLPLINKNDFIENADFDSNFINIFNDFLALCDTNSVDAYSSATTYTLGNYVVYNNKLWESVSSDAFANVTPGTDTDYWVDRFPTILGHIQNSDTILAENTANEVTASEIRAFIDAGLTSTTNLSISENTGVSLKINSSTGTDVTLTIASETIAGLLSATDKIKLNNLSGVNTGDQTLESLGAEAVSNKATDFSILNDVLYPTTEAVSEYLITGVATAVESFIGDAYVSYNEDDTVTINGAYTLPNVDGTAGQVPTTDGAGNVSWGTVSSGGLTYFTEAQNTASPNATVNVDSLTAIASTTNADISIVPKGTGSFTLAIPDNLASGGNKRGANAIDLQTTRSANTQVASGANSFTAGASNTANNASSVALGSGNVSTGEASFASGKNNSATTEQSIAMGINNNATGNRSVSIGLANSSTGGTSYCFGNGNLANRSYAVAIGYNCTSAGDSAIAIGNSVNTFLQHGRISFSSGAIGASGDIQKSFYILKGRTTNATPKTLTSDNGGVTTASIMVLQNNNVIRFKGSIVGKQTGTTNIAVWDIDGVIVRGANAAATTLTISNVNLVTNASSWGTPTLTADTTLGGLTINAIGLAATNIQWIANFETSEVIY